MNPDLPILRASMFYPTQPQRDRIAVLAEAEKMHPATYLDKLLAAAEGKLSQKRLDALAARRRALHTIREAIKAEERPGAPT